MTSKREEIEARLRDAVREGGGWPNDAALERYIARAVDETIAALAVFEQAHTPTDDEGTPEFESLEQELFKHQPVLSMRDGHIAGCQCMDRVFQERTEDWGTHLAEVFTALRRPIQGEPAAFDQRHADHEHVGPYCMPQGEPTDAAQRLELEHLPHLDRLGGDWNQMARDIRDALAALRAAAAVTEQGGESR